MGTIFTGGIFGRHYHEPEDPPLRTDMNEEKSTLSLELDNQKLALRVRELEQKLLMAEATIAQRAELLTEVQDTATHYAIEAKDLRSKLFTALLDLLEYEKQFGKLPHNS